jgi:hypothetical protein
MRRQYEVKLLHRGDTWRTFASYSSREEAAAAAATLYLDDALGEMIAGVCIREAEPPASCG